MGCLLLHFKQGKGQSVNRFRGSSERADHTQVAGIVAGLVRLPREELNPQAGKFPIYLPFRLQFFWLSYILYIFFPTITRHIIESLMTKPTKWPVRPAKTQISLGIRRVWTESTILLTVLYSIHFLSHHHQAHNWEPHDKTKKMTCAPSEDSDQSLNRVALNG